MFINDSAMESPVREAVRTIEAKASETNYLIGERTQHYALIENEDRNLFSKGTRAATLK